MDFFFGFAPYDTQPNCLQAVFCTRRVSKIAKMPVSGSMENMVEIKKYRFHLLAGEINARP